MCIPVVHMLSECAAWSSRHYTHSANLSQVCTPAGHAELTRDALEGGMAQKRNKRGVNSVTLCFCVRDDNTRKSQVFVLPGKVVLTVKLDTQVISSSPPVQSSLPSHALSIGMNFTERLQKKYLLSINCLTGGKRSGTLEEKGRTQV